MCTKTSINPCRLDVLRVTGIALDDIAVHQDFNDQFRRSKDGWYETGLMWKDNATSPQNNKLRRLGTLKKCCEIYKEIKSYSRVMIRLFKNNLPKE